MAPKRRDQKTIKSSFEDYCAQNTLLYNDFTPVTTRRLAFNVLDYEQS